MKSARRKKRVFYTRESVSKTHISFRRNSVQLSRLFVRSSICSSRWKFFLRLFRTISCLPTSLRSKIVLSQERALEEASLSFENFNDANYLRGWKQRNSTETSRNSSCSLSLSLFLVSSHVRRAI